MTNLAENLVMTAIAHPARTAVRHDDLVLTYADLDDLSARVADTSTLRICVSGGAALPVEVLRG